jgi:hypothetical protein
MVTDTFRPSPAGRCRGSCSSNSAGCPNGRRIDWRCWTEESVLHLGATILKSIREGRDHMMVMSDQMNAPTTNRAMTLELFSGDPDFMASLAKGLIVLEVLNSSSGPPTIANLSRATGLSRAAVRRCLYTLSKLGYVRSTKDGHRELWSRMRIIPSSAGLQKTLTSSVGSHSQRSGGGGAVHVCDQR